MPEQPGAPSTDGHPTGRTTAGETDLTHDEDPKASVPPETQRRGKPIPATGLTYEEVDAITADLIAGQEGRTEALVRAERRDALRFAATMLKNGEQLPQLLREWLGERLAQLHEALEAGGEPAVRQVLIELGKKPRGNSPSGIALKAAKSAARPERKGRRRPTSGASDSPGKPQGADPVDSDEQDVAVAAAVAWISARLKSLHGANVIGSITTALGLSEDTVREAVASAGFDASDNVELLALAAPVLDRLQRSVADAPAYHSTQIRDLVQSIRRG